MAALISAGRAGSLMPGLSAAELAALPALVGAATAAVESYCRRPLTRASRTLWAQPGRAGSIRVPGKPLVSIDRVCGDREAFLMIRRDNVAGLLSGRVVRASANLAAGQLILSETTAAGTTETTINLGGLESVADLADRVADAPGWRGVVLGGRGDWPASDLLETPGPLGALNAGAAIHAYATELDGWDISDRAAGIIALGSSIREGFRYPDRAHGRDWGPNNGRDRDRVDVVVTYTAGYLVDEAPGDLEQATLMTIRALLEAPKISGWIKSASLGNSSFTVAEGANLAAVPAHAKSLLTGYVMRGV